MTPGIELTPQDAERLRQILGAYEAKNPQSIKEFDLAKPLVPPYRFQEFPKVMYRHETREHRQCRNAKEQAEAEANGWSAEPAPFDEPEIKLQMTQDEMDQVAVIEAARKKKKAA